MLSDVPWSVVFTYAGDLLSVIAMAIMASTARSAWRRTRPEARVPLMGARFSRNLGFGLVPTAGILILIVPALAIAYLVAAPTGLGRRIWQLFASGAARTATVAAQLRKIAVAAWRIVGGAGYGRVDLRIDERGRPWILEVNANPDIAPDAGLARMARVAGIDYGAGHGTGYGLSVRCRHRGQQQRHER